ncbi:hypothetical protein BLA29_001566, partial [Euroglyphus maynei]
DTDTDTDTDKDSKNAVHVSPLELLTVYGYSRGFMTQRGLPDTSKAAKYILKDFVQGRICYCYAPPGVIQQHQYHQFTVSDRIVNRGKITDRKLQRVYEGNNLLARRDFDQDFFNQTSTSAAHIKGGNNNKTNESGSMAKPWKNHQHKRNRKEKLRRVYGHLDN